MVTFVITNKCGGQCSFDLEGISAGAILEHRVVGDMDGRAGTGRLPLPLRRRPISMRGRLDRHRRAVRPDAPVASSTRIATGGALLPSEHHQRSRDIPEHSGIQVWCFPDGQHA